MTNAEKFKEVFGISITHRSVTSDKWLFSEYNGTPIRESSVIEDIKTELPEHSFWQDAGGEPLVAIRDVLEIIDRKVNEVTDENDIPTGNT